MVQYLECCSKLSAVLTRHCCSSMMMSACMVSLLLKRRKKSGIMYLGSVFAICMIVYVWENSLVLTPKKEHIQYINKRFVHCRYTPFLLEPVHVSIYCNFFFITYIQWNLCS